MNFRITPHCEKTTLFWSEKFSIPWIVAKILNQRGITQEEIENFLTPKMMTSLPSPFILNNMEKGARRLKKAIDDGETIAIYGDYDVDGACSSAMLRDYLQQRGVETILYIPDRLQEGYGANENAMINLFDRGVSLVLMVDCGSTAHKPLEKAQNIGMEVIVLDHHACDHVLPPGIIINPHRPDQNLRDREDLKYLCAAGVVFLFLVAVESYFRQMKPAKIIDLFQFLDLVALATVCDVMLLKGLNRTFVYQGLKVLSKSQRSGIQALLEISGVQQKLSTYHLGFVLGPRINATGRIGESHLGSVLLTTKQHLTAQKIASRLHDYNAQRQQMEKTALEEAIAQIETKSLHKRHVIVVSNENWHPGIVGIVASRLKDRYQKPSFVISIQAHLAKGSGRSIPGLHLGSLMHKAMENHLLIGGGGHEMAAGLTAYATKVVRFYDFLDEEIGKMVLPKVVKDVVSYMPLQGVTHEFLDHLEMLEPFGQGHPQPRFLVGPVSIGFRKIVAHSHIQCTLVDEHGYSIKGVAFRCVGSRFGTFLMENMEPFYALGVLKREEWSGKLDISLTIEDVYKYQDIQSLDMAC